jgi:putative PIN family toxin of toxin-antitoxin system
MPKAVLDSAILVSAFLTKSGLSAELLQHARAGVFDLYVAEEIFGEATRVLLEYGRIRRRYRYTDQDVVEFFQALRAAVHLVIELPRLSGVSRDPKDDMVLACAIKASADYLVTRDDDLLTLETYKKIIIVTPEQFMAILRNPSRRSVPTTEN